MEYDTADRYIDQLDYYQLMSEITEHQYSETEFDPYFPSTMAEQHYDRYSDELQACQTSMHQALSTESSCYTPYIDSQQCLSTPTFDFSAPNFGYNSLRADTLYSSMPLSNESTTEAPQSPAESSSSGSNSETESTGTPDKFSRHTSRTKRQSRAKSSSCARRTNKRKKGKLWEFLLDLLMSEETNPSIIKWEDQSKGIFRILDCSHVAYLWGKRKSNPSMTYEKLSRALRYYYDLKILMKIEGHKLLYRFGDLSLA